MWRERGRVGRQISVRTFGIEVEKSVGERYNDLCHIKIGVTKVRIQTEWLLQSYRERQMGSEIIELWLLWSLLGQEIDRITRKS